MSDARTPEEVEAAEIAGPEAHRLRPMPRTDDPSTWHGGTAAESVRQQSGHRPMPRSDDVRPPQRVAHQS
jgi:hypothetical protein